MATMIADRCDVCGAVGAYVLTRPAPVQGRWCATHRPAVWFEGVSLPPDRARASQPPEIGLGVAIEVLPTMGQSDAPSDMFD